MGKRGAPDSRRSDELEFAGQQYVKIMKEVDATQCEELFCALMFMGKASHRTGDLFLRLLRQLQFCEPGPARRALISTVCESRHIVATLFLEQFAFDSDRAYCIGRDGTVELYCDLMAAQELPQESPQGARAAKALAA